MFWDKKSSGDLPDLPPMRAPSKPLTPVNTMPTSSMDEEEDDDFSAIEKHQLPSFPDSPHKIGFSQAAIKEAVTNLDELPEFPEQTSSFTTPKTLEMEEWTPEHKMLPPPSLPMIPSMHQDISEMPHMVQPRIRNETPQMQSSPQFQPAQKNSDIFIKLTKFHTAKKALQEAEEKVSDLDKLLKKIRETKMREEQELSSWEKEVAIIKSRIDNIQENLFDKA